MAQIENSILSKLIDWKDFELFVTEMYKHSDEVVVQHNVTEIGKSNAKRQIDVLVTQKTKLHTLKILVECKFWKDKVDRPVIDVLAAAIEDLNAAKGVIFTTVGYEDGAIQYAKNKNIDIFIIRNVSNSDWSNPGRNILLYLHEFNGKIHSVSFEGLKLVNQFGKVPDQKSLTFDIVFQKDLEPNDKLTLYSYPGLERGNNVTKLITEIRNMILKRWMHEFDLLIQPDNEIQELAYETPVTIDVANYKFKYLKIGEEYLTFDCIKFSFLQSVTQTRIDFDRAGSKDFVYVVENYITNQKNFITKAKDNTSIELSDPIKENIAPTEDTFVNGSSFKVMMDYYIDFAIREKTIVRKTKPITVNVQNPETTIHE